MDRNDDNQLDPGDETTLYEFDADHDGTVDFHELFGGEFIDQIIEFLTDPIFISADFIDFVNGLNIDTGPVVLSVSSITDTSEPVSPDLSFSLSFELSVTQEFPLDLGTEAQLLGIDLSSAPMLTVRATLNFALDFGVSDLLGTKTFFVDPSRNLTFSVDTVNGGVPDEVDLPESDLNVGFLGAQVTDGTAELAAAVETNFVSDAGNILADGAIGAKDTFSLELSAAANDGLGSFAPTFEIALSGKPLSDPAELDPDEDGNQRLAVPFEPTGAFADVLDFNTITPASVISMMRGFESWLENLRTSDLYSSFDVPLTDATFADIFAFGDLFHDAFLYDESDSTAHLLDENGAPTFSTAQELAGKLNEALPDDVNARYDSDRGELLFDIDITGDFDPQEVGADSDFDLRPLMDVDSSSVFMLTGNTTLTLTMGIDLSPSESTLSTDTNLTDLNYGTGASVKTDEALTAENVVRILYGRLSGDAEFNIVIDGDDDNPYIVEVLADDTTDNEFIPDLVADLNSALEAVLGGQITAVQATDDDGDPIPRIELRAENSGIGFFELTADSDNPAVRELGFRTEMKSEEALVVDAPNELSLDRGQLTENASFDIEITESDDPAVAKTVSINKAETSTNLNADALIEDINDALQSNGISAITAELADGKIRFIADDTVTSFSITDPSGFDQLGFDDSGPFESAAVATPTITSATDLPKIVGRLTGDSSFEVQLDGEDPVTVTIHADDTSANQNILDLVDDINRALSEVALRWEPVITDVLTEQVQFTIIIDGGSGVPPVILDAEATNGTATAAFDGSDETGVINTIADTICLGSHSFQTGDIVTYSSGSGTAVGGLTDSTDYYIIFVDFDTVKLATSADNALAGTAVDLAGAGTGTDHSLTGNGISANTDIEQLVFDLNAALHRAGLGDLLEATSDGDRIKLAAIHEGVEQLSLTPDAEYPAAVAQLGLPEGTTTVRHFRAGDRDPEELIFRAGNLGDRLVFTADPSIQQFTITQSDADNPAVTELGLGTLQISDTVDLLVTLSDGTEIPVDLSDAETVGDVLEAINLAGNGDILATLNNVGRLSADAHFTLTVDGEAPVDVVVPWAKTIDNVTAGDLAEDINGALAKTDFAGQFEASASDNGLRILLAATGGVTAFTLSTSSTDLAVTEIGLPAGETSDTDGTISADTDLRGTGLRLVDLTFDGGTPENNVEIFRVEATNGSPAAFQLGLLRKDQKSADDDPDGVIEGGNLAGKRLADRFFVQKEGAVVGDFEVSPFERSIADLVVKQDDGNFYIESVEFTEEDFGRLFTISGTEGYFRIVDIKVSETEPTEAYVESLNGELLSEGDIVEVEFPGIQAAGRYGFDGIELIGEGALSGRLETTILDPGQDPDASLPFYQDDGSATLAELDNGLADPDVTAVEGPVASPSNGSGDYGQLVLDVIMDPVLGTLIAGAALGANPQITLTVENLGDPFHDLVYTDAALDSADIFTLPGNLTEIRTKARVQVELEVDGETETRASRVQDVKYDETDGRTIVTLADTVLEGSLVTVTVSDTPDIQVTTTNLNDLELFADLEYDHTLNSLEEVSQFLRAFEISGELDDSLSFINRSVNDLLGFADRFDDAVQSAGDNPAETLQALEGKLRETLGIPADDTESLILSLFVDDQSDSYLRIDLRLENLLSEALQVDLDLDTDRLVTPKVLKGVGDIAIDLAFGVKLHDPDPSQAETLYDAYLFEDTGLAGSLSSISDSINSWAVLRPNDDGIEPLSVYIAEGAAELVVEFEAAPDADIFNDGSRPILETITTDGRVELDASSFLTSDVTAELPLYYPTISGPPLVVITVPSPETSTSADVSVADGIRLAQAENGSAEDSTPYNHILTAVENVDMFLEGIQDLLDGEVLGITLPFIGDRLAEAARFIEDLRKDFIAPLRDGVESFSDPNTNQLSQLFFELLGPDGINLLLDTNDDNTVDIEDIGFTIQVDENDQFVQWDLKIGHELQPMVGVDIDLDLGIPGLGIDIDGPINLLLGWDLDLKLGVSTKDGPYLDISDNDDLKLELAVELPTSITGKLGFLQLDAESLLEEGEYPLQAAFAVDLVSQLALKAETIADPFTFTADGDNPAVTELWFEEQQESFFGSVVSSNEVPENGRLSGDLEFQLEADGTTTYSVSVALDAYSDNFTREDLIADINVAINDAGASGLYAAGLDGSLLTIKRNSIVRDFKVTTDANNELGIPTEAESGKKNFITFGGNLPANGKLENDVEFTLSINEIPGGLYEYEVEVTVSPDNSNNSRDDLVKDITDAIEDVLPNDLKGQFELASGDPRMSFWELGDMGIEFGLAAEAVADLGLTLKINSDLVGEGGVFPEVSADFLMEWGIGKIENNDNNDYVGFSGLGTVIMDGLELVQFTDVSLDLGSFISDFVGPVLDQVKKITEPVQPVIDFLTAPIPVISDLGPTVTMLDIAGIFGNVNSGFITAIADVITLINSIPTDTDSVLINFGDFVIYKKNEVNEGLDLSDPKTTQNLNELDNWSKDFDFGKAMKGKPPSKTSKFTKTVNKSEGFSFPILEDASQVFGMLVGKPATLMTYDLPDLTLKFTYEQYFPIFGPLGASITGSIGATIDFHEVGFDTSGIIRFADSGFRNPGLIFDGFYISDLDKAGNDVPEVTLFGGLSAAAEINAVVVSAGVAGGVYAEIEFDLYDPDEDGKVRVSEIIGSVINEYRFGKPALSPLAMFDISGEVYARLFAFFEIDLFFFSIRKEFNILPPITILSFDFPFTHAPYLATELPGGVLQVNAGEFAGERKNVNDQDGSEYFVVIAKTNAVTVTALGFSQKYTPDGAFDTIVLATGEGDDVLEIDLDEGVHLELDLGAGNDQVTITGEGSATIYGGPGDDVIFAGNGVDVIYGGEGNDTIYGGGGEDIIFGGIGVLKEDEFGTKLRVSVSVRDDEGTDTIYGGEDDDIIFGGGGSDILKGGTGDDLIIADAGSFDFDENGNVPTNSPEVDITQIDTRSFLSVTNRLFGGEGQDTIFGGRGDDFIDGGADNDQILGLAGYDVLYGGSGADSIWGGTGDDIIFGYNSDTEDFEAKGLLDDIVDIPNNQPKYRGIVSNFNGDETDVTTDSGDHLYGEDGNDIIFGGNEPDDDTIDDYIEGGRGVNYMYGEEGDDILQSGLESTVIYGGDGSDTYNIYMRGGANNSLITVSDLGTSPLDTDELFVFGTDFDDQFLLRASADLEGLAFVVMLNGDDEVERINYDGLERLTVNGLAGNDRFAVDDARAEATLNGGVGEDFFQIGQLYRSPRAENEAANIDPGDEFATIEITRGFLSNGITLPMTINGGADNDEFIVFHNKAVLTLNGGTGNDNFTVRAFALAGSQDNLRERTDISGGSGADLIQYAVNAPVNIDGGDGLDTVVVIGTEFNDDFVVTEDGVYGGGLNVNFVGIEVLRVDGAEGDDRFFVLSTGENFITEIFGGLGSDTFNMSGETPPVISNDLLGHSGIITHGVESIGADYNDLTVVGISANVADNDEPAIRITETGGFTVVGENGLQDTYTVVLTRQPWMDVYVKALAPVQTPEEEEYDWKALTVRSEHPDANNEGSVVTLTFTPDNWFMPQTVIVEAPPDGKAEGVRFGAINHIVSTEETIVDNGNVVSATADTLTAEGNPFAGLEGLSGAILEITGGTGKGQVRVIESWTGNTLTLYTEWDATP